MNWLVFPSNEINCMTQAKWTSSPIDVCTAMIRAIIMTRDQNRIHNKVKRTIEWLSFNTTRWLDDWFFFFHFVLKCMFFYSPIEAYQSFNGNAFTTFMYQNVFKSSHSSLVSITTHYFDNCNGNFQMTHFHSSTGEINLLSLPWREKFLMKW